MSYLRVAHRGAPDEAPENTLASFRAALTHPIDAIELDVRFSRDGHPVVHHDADLTRTAGRPDCVADLTREELLKLDVGSSFAPGFAGERIPRLADALAAIGVGVRTFVELKDGPDLDEERARLLARELREGADGNTVTLTSFHAPVLMAMRDRIAHLRTALVRHDTGADPVDELTRTRASMLFLRHDAVTDEIVTFCAVAGYPVVAWTVDDRAELERVEDCGVAGVVTNRPALFAEV